MNAAVQEIAGEFAKDTRIRLVVVVDDHEVLAQAGPDLNDLELVRELCTVARRLQNGLGNGNHHAVFEFPSSVLLVFSVGRAQLIGLGSDPLARIFLEAQWNRNCSALAHSLSHTSARASQARRAANGDPLEIRTLLREVQSRFVHYRREERDRGAQTDRIFSGLVSDWEAICDPSVYTFPLLLDSLTQAVSTDAQRRAQFTSDIQTILRVANSSAS